jgi:hypothetical protein
LVDGKEGGWCKRYLNSASQYQYHSGFAIDTGDIFPTMIQGFGDTKEGAILNALEKGKAHATALLDGIAELAVKLSI